jgi:glycosyltransferase involved in cell wall biosynthesis
VTVRVLVYPHELSVGGSQLNAVELAAAVRDLGHEVAVFGVPGPLTTHIEALGLDLTPVAEAPRRPSPAVMRRLVEVVGAERIDLVHGYEWPPALEAYYGPQLRLGVPALCTILSMGVASFLPSSMPLVVGTRQLVEQASRTRRGRVDLLEPPVDTDANHPGVDPSRFREAFGLDPSRPAVVVVSRLAVDLKLEGLERAVAAAGRLAPEVPLQLVIVGDGPAADRLAARAAEVNAAHPGTVVLTGQLLDPRPAYAAADVALGMGGSILRALAFAKPAIVLGEDGFSETLTPQSKTRFLWHGFYGLGDGDLGPERLAGQLRELLTDPGLMSQLGDFSRELVCERFSLTGAARSLESLYGEVVAEGAERPRAIVEGAVAGAKVVRYKLQRRRLRRRGAHATDDFNARPVLEPVPAGAQSEERTT